MSKSKDKYIHELDGLRAVSVFFVLAVHASYGHLSGGFLGVDIFFVLSGYLITTLISQERRNRGKVDLYRFYARRAIRIIPPMVICVLLALALWSTDHACRKNAAMASLFFFANFVEPETMGSLAHTWSLSIEEQFYLVWPTIFILLATSSGKKIIWFASIVIVAAIAFRLAAIQNGADVIVLYSSTLSRMDSLMMGCFLAIAQECYSAKLQFSSRTAGLIVWLSSLILIAFLLFASREFMQSNAFAFTGFAMISAALIMSIQKAYFRNPIRRALLHPLAQYVGRRSYSLYLYHYPIFIALDSFRVAGRIDNYLLITLSKVALSMALAEISWRLVERPMLALKNRAFSVGVGAIESETEEKRENENNS